MYIMFYVSFNPVLKVESLCELAKCILFWPERISFLFFSRVMMQLARSPLSSYAGRQTARQAARQAARINSMPTSEFREEGKGRQHHSADRLSRHNISINAF
jgi:hypothetical protein